MRFRTLPTVVAALLLVAVASGASAAEDKKISFGAQLDWGSDTDLGFGARLRYDLGDVREGLAVVGSFDYYMPEGDVSYFEVNANATYDIPVKGSATPYVGAGLLFARSSVDVGVASGSSSDIGLNLLGGLNFKVGDKLKLFAEAKVEIMDGSQFVLSAGVRF